MSSQPEQFRDRTKPFALRVIRLYRSLPFRTDCQLRGKQLLRCGASGAANYRAACRARTKAEFVAKVGIVLEESDDAVLWLELLAESGIVQADKTEALFGEARELTAIFYPSRRTAKEVRRLSITQLPDSQLCNEVF